MKEEGYAMQYTSDFRVAYFKKKNIINSVIYLIAATITFEAFFLAATGFNIQSIKDQRLFIFNLLSLFWLGMETTRVRLGHKQRKSFGKFSRSFLIISFTCILFAVCDRSINFHQVRPFRSSLSASFGISLFALGVYLRHLSIKTLGKYFVTKVQLTENHELITDGIYRVVRHPSYTGLICACIGLIIFLESFSAFIAFLILGLPSYIYRIKIEEKALQQAFGQQYERYCRKTHMLIPLFY